jgi:hypothetical protein
MERLKLRAVAGAALVVLAACGSIGPSGSQRKSGIEGVAVAGPQCPVEVVGSPCPARPVSVTLTVIDSAGGVVTTFTTSADGRFQVELTPGTYMLATRVKNGPQLLRPVTVNVKDGAYTEVRLFLDTGIR